MLRTIIMTHGACAVDCGAWINSFYEGDYDLDESFIEANVPEAAWEDILIYGDESPKWNAYGTDRNGLSRRRSRASNAAYFDELNALENTFGQGFVWDGQMGKVRLDHIRFSSVHQYLRVALRGYNLGTPMAHLELKMCDHPMRFNVLMRCDREVVKSNAPKGYTCVHPQSFPWVDLIDFEDDPHPPFLPQLEYFSRLNDEGHLKCTGQSEKQTPDQQAWAKQCLQWSDYRAYQEGRDNQGHTRSMWHRGLAHLPPRLSPTTAQPIVEGVSKLIEKFDGDQDGHINRAEFTSLSFIEDDTSLDYWVEDDAATDHLFMALDIDRNGSLSPKELHVLFPIRGDSLEATLKELSRRESLENRSGRCSLASPKDYGPGSDIPGDDSAANATSRKALIISQAESYENFLLEKEFTMENKILEKERVNRRHQAILDYNNCNQDVPHAVWTYSQDKYTPMHGCNSARWSNGKSSKKLCQGREMEGNAVNQDVPFTKDAIHTRSQYATKCCKWHPFNSDKGLGKCRVY